MWLLNVITKIKVVEVTNNCPEFFYPEQRLMWLLFIISACICIKKTDVIVIHNYQGQGCWDANNGSINGLPLVRAQLSLNHLFFTNDRTDLLSWMEQVIFLILEICKNASGQKLNKYKTSIYFSQNTRQETKNIITSITTGIRTSNSYEKYLGLLDLVGKSTRHGAFKSILDLGPSK